jgi:drug/metabolite transporter (DMT)-like permease
MPRTDHGQRNAALALALLSLIWGYNWVMMKIGLADADPLAFATLRFGLGALCMVPVAAKISGRLLPEPGHWRPLAVLGGMLAVNFGCTLTALKLGGTGKTAVLTYTMPFWVLAFARVTLHERPTRWQYIAGVVALLGLVVLIRPWDIESGLAPSLLAVAAGMFWAASIVYVKNLQKQGSLSMSMITVWQMAIGSALLGMAWALTETTPIKWTTSFAVALAYNSILGTGVAWMLFYYALRRMPAGMAGLGTLATPVIGVVAAWMQFGERPLPIEAAGMSLVGLGLAMLAWTPSRPGRNRVA